VPASFRVLSVLLSRVENLFLLRLCSKNHRVSKMHQLTSIAGLIFVQIAPFLLNKDTLIVALLCIVSVML